jgi:hypothetical protein
VTTGIRNYPRKVLSDREKTIRATLARVPASTSSGGAPTDASYLTLATNATLTVERVFTPGTNLAGVDAGAGGTYTLNTGALLLNKHALVANFTITAGYAAVIPRYIEVGSGFTLEVGADSDLEVL